MNRVPSPQPSPIGWERVPEGRVREGFMAREQVQKEQGAFHVQKEASAGASSYQAGGVTWRKVW